MNAPQGWESVERNIEAGQCFIDVHGGQVFRMPDGRLFVTLDGLKSISVRHRTITDTFHGVTVTKDGVAVSPAIGEEEDTWAFRGRNMVAASTSEGTESILTVRYGKAAADVITLVVGNERRMLTLATR